MEAKEQIESVIDVLKDLQEDSVPRNVKDKIDVTVEALQEKNEISIKVHKALHELESIADDPNLQPYTRTQIWNVVSVLEKIA